jgi:hypothetical protein
MKTMLLLAVVVVAVVQWLVVALIAMTTREKFPKKGLRGIDRTLVASSIVLAIGFLAQLDYSSWWRRSTPVANASVTVSRGSCATVAEGMTVADVKKRMGTPDRMTPDEETRGPGAVTLVYESSRCSVHVVGGRVEFVD